MGISFKFWQFTCTYCKQCWDQVTCGGRLLLCRFIINHSRWWNTDQGSVVIGNVIQILLGNRPRCGRKCTSTRTINSIIVSQERFTERLINPTSVESRITLFMLILALNTTWRNHLASCWTSWRRWASAFCRWRVWDRHWSGVSTRRRSDCS